VGLQSRRYHSDDDDRDHKRPKPRGFINKVSSWIDGCSRSRSKPRDGGTRGGGGIKENHPVLG
jgi:hypothetical protein